VSSAGQPAFEGVYLATGVGADGREYRRAVDIERHGDRFTITWVAAEMVGQTVFLEPTWVGVGIATGDALSVSFVAEDIFGIIVCQFGGDGRLSGRWTVAGEDETVYTETLTRLPDILPEPDAADLTMYTARNGGVFPGERLRQIIAGRGPAAHGDRTMPVWGVAFLQSIQQRGAE